MFNTKARTSGRARVTKRIESEPDERGRRTLLAREGELVSIAEAFRRGIPEEALEPVGPGGRIAFAALRADEESESPEEALSKAEAAARDAEREAQQAAEAKRSARIRGEVDDEDQVEAQAELAVETETETEPSVDSTESFPQHLAGGQWLLSDGSKVGPSMKREDAEAAEAALLESSEDEADTSDEESETPEETTEPSESSDETEES